MNLLFVVRRKHLIGQLRLASFLHPLKGSHRGGGALAITDATFAADFDFKKGSPVARAKKLYVKLVATRWRPKARRTKMTHFASRQ